MYFGPYDTSGECKTHCDETEGCGAFASEPVLSLHKETHTRVVLVPWSMAGSFSLYLLGFDTHQDLGQKVEHGILVLNIGGLHIEVTSGVLPPHAHCCALYSTPKSIILTCAKLQYCAPPADPCTFNTN